MSETKRYLRLAPLDVEVRTQLALSALYFFSTVDYREKCVLIGKEPDQTAIRPFGGFDFIRYLEKSRIIEEPFRYVQHIRELLERMAATGVLVDMGTGNDSNATLPKYYYFQKELSKAQTAGLFWLTPALGPDFLYHHASSAVVQIVGKDRKGDVHAGTGIVFAPNHVLTCAHVVTGMEINKEQFFQGATCRVDECFADSTVDVAVVRVDQPVAPAPGLSFLSPRIAQSVFTLGYPRIPRILEPALTMQRGEVTSESVTTFERQNVFLYSAIARPGNSGGPIISSDGYVVGISVQDLFQSDDKYPFAPHYAGIPTLEIARCLDELDIGVQIPIEDFS